MIMRSVDEMVLDGNAAAGVLALIFAVDVTASISTCAGCGSTRALGAARLYSGPGYVLRCTDCGGALLRVVTAQGRTFVTMTGIRVLEIRDS
jgi:hypothetical protein